MQKMNYGAHGYAGMLCTSLLDAHWKPGMTEAEGLHLMGLCAAEMQRRFALAKPRWIIKIVDKNGIRKLEMPTSLSGFPVSA